VAKRHWRHEFHPPDQIQENLRQNTAFGRMSREIGEITELIDITEQTNVCWRSMQLFRRLRRARLAGAFGG
jgi:hypothetical protein